MKRHKDAVKLNNIRLTDRDREVLHQVALNRFMETLQIQRSIAPRFNQNAGALWDYNNLVKRLKLLHHHGYLHLPESQRRLAEFKEGGGSFPKVYSLGAKGATELQKAPDKYHIESIEKFTVNKDNRLSKPQIPHTVLTTEVTVQMMQACFANGMRFHDESEIIRKQSAPDRTLLHSGTRGWNVPAHPAYTPEDSGLIPDRMNCIQIPDVGSLFFFVESDTGNEPIASDRFDRATPEKKIRLYRSTAKRRLLQQHFPAITSFDVLFVTSVPSRVQGIIKASQRIGGGWQHILVTDEKTFKRYPFLEVPWLEGKGGTTVTLENVIRDQLQRVIAT